MKRFAAIGLILLFLLLLPGCFHAGKGQDVVEVQPDPTSLFEPVTPSPVPASPTPTPSATPEPTPTPKPYAAKDGVYTIAWMSDTQHYSKMYPEVYEAMTQFLFDKRDEMNLCYIIHTGDLVHNTDLETEWDAADRAQTIIDDIPNGVLAGNHDVFDPIGYQTFCERFGETRYKDKPWYGGSYENNRGHYDLLTIGDTDYIFVYMGFAPTKKAYKWVYDVFQKFPDRVGILCLHDYYTKELQLSDAGTEWYNRVVKKIANLYMVLCGHKYGAYLFPETFDDDGDGKADRTVYQMLFNYQATKHDGGGGYLRLMQIDDAEGTLHMLTYSPVTDDFNRFDDPDMRETYYEFDETHEEFIVPLPWRITYGETN